MRALPAAGLLYAEIGMSTTTCFLLAGFCLAHSLATAQTPAFRANGNSYEFDTGSLRGMLRAPGAEKSPGLHPVIDSASGKPVSGEAFGLVAHYRLLDANARYGEAGWTWASTSRLLADGAVEVSWAADSEHPFDMKAIYRWSGPQALDVATTVTARKDLLRFELFLASYFEKFPTTLVCVKRGPETGGKPGFVEVTEAQGHAQVYPRDDQAVKINKDGRWRRPPHPVDWAVRPHLAMPLAMRRAADSDLTGVLMAPKKDCFALSALGPTDFHRSLYLSLFGKDIKEGRSATARARLVVGHDISAQQAIELYKAYLKELKR